MNTTPHSQRLLDLHRGIASSLSALGRSWRAPLWITASLFASSAGAQTVFVLSNDGLSFRTAPTAYPAAVSQAIAITGVAAGESLVAIDVRPQSQQLYALGVNATANTATLYSLSPQTGFAAAVGTAGSIAYVDAGGNPVDFPDPATVGWDIDFNPAADRLRVVTGSLNYRVNPNTGAPVDGDQGGGAGSVAGVNPDGAINGSTTSVSATAYTNSQPNNGGITTQYTLDASTNSLFIQNPPNAGTQTSALAVTLSGTPLDFSAQVGFDIAPAVNAFASNAAVTAGSGFALFTVGGTSGLYAINLVNGQATFTGALSGRSLAIRQELGAAIAMTADGTGVARFNVATPGTTTTVAISGTTAGETLVGIDFRPQTGQFYALGVNATTDTATLYRLDPQTGALSVVGSTSAITFPGTNFPDPATAGYGIDFNPAVDRLRVVTSTGLNFRINPNTGAAAALDVAISGSGSTGVSAAAYTNSFGQSLTGGVTTQYTLDATLNSLLIQNPPNSGTQTAQIPLTVGGSPLDFTDRNGFDIPSAVRVTTSGSAATGEGWFVATVGGVTGLYRLDLTTGAATSLGNIGAGSTPLAGLTVFTTPALDVRDSANALIFDGQDTIDFGTTAAGATATATVSVQNRGSQPLRYTATIPAGTYAITQNATGTVLPGGAMAVEIIYTGGGTGPESATLSIATNDTAIPSFEIQLTGNSPDTSAEIAAAEKAAVDRAAAEKLAAEKLAAEKAAELAKKSQPSVSDVQDQTVVSGASTAAIPFTVGPVGATLTVSATSSDQVLVPNADIVLGGSGESRTVTIKAAANESGPVTITLSVTDGQLTAADTFLLTVTPGAPPELRGQARRKESGSGGRQVLPPVWQG